MLSDRSTRAAPISSLDIHFTARLRSLRVYTSISEHDEEQCYYDRLAARAVSEFTADVLCAARRTAQRAQRGCSHFGGSFADTFFCFACYKATDAVSLASSTAQSEGTRVFGTTARHLSLETTQRGGTKPPLTVSQDGHHDCSNDKRKWRWRRCSTYARRSRQQLLAVIGARPASRCCSPSPRHDDHRRLR